MSGLIHIHRARERVPDCRAATLKLRASNEVPTNGTESRTVFDDLRDRVK